MASTEPKKANSTPLREADFMSNLPDDVKEKILTYLPIKEAGRTSILSSKWRYTWASIPELVFTDDINPPNLVELVDEIFIFHNGPIRKFSLVTGVDVYKAVDRWVGILSRNGIRELTLDLSNFEYILNPRFFSCEELNSINLTNCSFKLPLLFKGFKFLHTLALKCLEVFADDIEKLISSCPLLKELRLTNLREPVDLNIHAPNLQILDIRSEFSDLKVRAPNLLSLYVDLETPARNQPCHNKFEQVLGNVSALEEFQLSGYFLPYLSDETFTDGFSQTFNRLKNLDFLFDFADEKEAAFVLAMFRRSPHLKSLDINVVLTEERPTLPIAKFWERVDRREGLFKHLQTVNVHGFASIDSIFSFVEFILRCAPQLVALTLEKYAEEKTDEGIMLRQLLRFKRASPSAEIIFQ